MKKKVIVILFAVSFIVIGSIIGISTRGANVQPGSIQDPLITKAYLDTRLKDLRTELGLAPSTGGTIGGGTLSSEAITQISLYLDKEIKDLKLELDKKIEANSGSAAAGYIAIKVPKGVRVLCFEGTEFIIRSGKATAIAYIDATGNVMGLSNVTSAGNLGPGALIPVNNLVIVPRTDGRGFESQSDGTYVMIKGKYTIE